MSTIEITHYDHSESQRERAEAIQKALSDADIPAYTNTVYFDESSGHFGDYPTIGLDGHEWGNSEWRSLPTEEVVDIVKNALLNAATERKIQSSIKPIDFS